MQDFATVSDFDGTDVEFIDDTVEHTEPDDTTDCQTSSDSPTTSPLKKKRQAGSWVYVNEWATKFDLPDGKEKIKCEARGCRYYPIIAKGNTSSISSHLYKVRSISKQSGPNTKEKVIGPIDRLLSGIKTPTQEQFSKTAFQEALINYIVGARLPYLIVESPQLQAPLNIVQSAPDLSSIKLPSAETISAKVNLTLPIRLPIFVTWACRNAFSIVVDIFEVRELQRFDKIHPLECTQAVFYL